MAAQIAAYVIGSAVVGFGVGWTSAFFIVWRDQQNTIRKLRN